jgi:hypothetical protein
MNIKHFIKHFFHRKKCLAILGGAGVILLIGSMLSKGFMMVSIFVLFAAICAVISFYQANLRSPIDLSPTFFFSIMVSIHYGVFYPLLFIPVASWIPALLAGGELGIAAIFYMGSWILSGFLAKIFIAYGIIYVGIGAVIINIIISFFVSKSLGDEGGFFWGLINGAITVFYFSSLGPLLFRILG